MPRQPSCKIGPSDDVKNRTLNPLFSQTRPLRDKHCPDRPDRKTPSELDRGVGARSQSVPMLGNPTKNARCTRGWQGKRSETQVV